MLRRAIVATALLATTAPQSAQSRVRPLGRPGTRDTVVKASTRYGASGLHRFFLGNNYRELWALPIRVPVLDLNTYAGGLQPLKEGGNAQTTNLRFTAASGAEYVFRPVYKDRLVLDNMWKGTLVSAIFADGLSASHPGAALIAPPFLEAAGVPHPTPILVVMPNDSALGRFRKDFAGALGTIEEYPSVPHDKPGFAGAVQIIDSDDLLERIIRDPRERIDAATMVKALLIDMLINDDDRHPGQWKWARMRRGEDAPWVPIPRDRDKAMVSYGGRLVSLGRYVLPTLIRFTDRIPSPYALFANAIEFDRRLLGGLDGATWDSVTTNLVNAISDSVIDAAVHRLPGEYQAAQPKLASTFRARRADLKRASKELYRGLFFGMSSTKTLLLPCKNPRDAIDTTTIAP
jgi:hypothetical protein